MPKIYKVSFLIQIDDDHEDWVWNIWNAVEDQLEYGDKLLKYTSVETTLEDELGPEGDSNEQI